MSCTKASPTWLLTGATGFLGTAIVRALRGRNYRLRTSGRRRLTANDLPNYQAADLRDQAAVARLVKGVDVVISAAGLTHGHGTPVQRDDDFWRINADGAESLIRAAEMAGVRRFILVSSISVYGRRCPPYTESAPCFPANAYAQSKLAAERISTEIARAAGMELVILRMAPICGEGARGNIDRLLQAIDRKRFIWIGSGTNRKSLIHVDDAASACVTAACFDSLPQGGVYNVSAATCTMHEIVSSLAVALGRHIPPVRLPSQAPLQLAGRACRLPVIGAAARRAFETLDKWLCDEVYDSSWFCDSFAWRPRIDIRDAMTRQVAWYRRSVRRCA
jgi:nucleoside-diphosphate-sugar epimerase